MQALPHPQFTLFGADPRTPEERRRDVLEEQKRELEGELYELGEEKDTLQEQLAALDTQTADVAAQLTELEDTLERLHRPDPAWHRRSSAESGRPWVPG